MIYTKGDGNLIYRNYSKYADLADELLYIIYQFHDTCKSDSVETIRAVRKVLSTLKEIANDGIDFRAFERAVMESLEFDLLINKDICREIAKTRRRSNIRRSYRRYHPRHM